MSHNFGNPEDGFCRVKAQLLYVSFKPAPEDFNIHIAITRRGGSNTQQIKITEIDRTGKFKLAFLPLINATVPLDRL